MAKTSEITMKRAVLIFTALGFKTADQWDIARIQKKLGKLHNLIEGAKLDTKTQKRVNEILRLQESGEKVIVVNPDNAVSNKRLDKDLAAAAKREKERKAEKRSKDKKTVEKTTKKVSKKTAKKVSKKTAKKTSKKTESKPVVRDKFGSKKGSSPSKINAAITRKPKLMAQLVKDAGVSCTYYEHVKKLIADGHVEKTDKGFRLTK